MAAVTVTGPRPWPWRVSADGSTRMRGSGGCRGRADCMVLGQLLEGQELLAHHHQVTPGQQHTPSPLQGRGGAHVEPDDQPAAAVVAGLDGVGDSQRPAEALEARLDDSGQALLVLELDQFEHQEPLAQSQALCPWGQPPGTAPSPIVEPVIAVGATLSWHSQRNTMGGGAAIVIARV